MLSKEVLSCLGDLTQFDYRKQHMVSSHLNDMGQKLNDEEDKYILSVISGALSMGYDEKDGTYCPMIVLSNGKRTFAMEDIDDKALSVLKEAIKVITPSWMRAQLGEIIWIKSKERGYLELSVDESLKEFDDLFDETNWVECFTMIRRAYALSVSQGKNSKAFLNVKEAIGQALNKMDGNDPLFLSINLIELDYENATGKVLTTYSDLTDKIFERHLAESGQNVHIVEAAHELYCAILKKMKREKDIETVRVKMAQYYETCADMEMRAEVAGTYRAIEFLRKACKQYEQTGNKEKLLQLRKRMEELQKVSLRNMAAIPFEFDATPIYNSITKLFEGLSLQEKIIQFGRTSQTYNKENIKNEVIKNSHKFLSRSLFTQNQLDGDGRTVEIIPPLDLQDPESDTDILYKHMVHHITEMRSLGETVSLTYAYRMMQSAGTISQNDLDFLVDNNPVIPDGRKDIMKFGLYLGLTGDLYAAMHILLPQTEHMIRNLVDMCGDTTSFLGDDGREEYKPLSKLFQSEKLVECYNENILFTFQTLIDSRVGPNLRNLNAHGLLGPDTGNSGVALIFLSFLIKFLSMYSKEGGRILVTLAEKEADPARPKEAVEEKQ